MSVETFVSAFIHQKVLKENAILSEKMELVDFAKELGYGDISTADNYRVEMMYVGEDGERKSMGYTYVCSELLYNSKYAGAINAVFAE